MKPPFELNSTILNLVSEISLLVGRYEGLHAPIPQPKLRRQNRIRTIKDSLAIEGNTLDLEQVTAIFDGRRVAGKPKEIREVQNAIQLYSALSQLNPTSQQAFLKAHGILMKGLVTKAGIYRTTSVGILKGTQVAHIAPPPRQVPTLMDNLFRFLKEKSDVSALIKACVFHYELEFIHPFEDGNGRMGRLWQSVILSHFHRAFEYLPVESIVRDRQSAYYEALETSDKKGECSAFVEFSLSTIRDGLKEFMKELQPEPETPESRLRLAKSEFGQKYFSRKDYIQFFKTLSTATASRDLARGVSQGILAKNGTKALTQYRFA